MENFEINHPDIPEASWWDQSIHWTECLWWIFVMDMLIFMIFMAAFDVHPKAWRVEVWPCCIQHATNDCNSDSRPQC